MNNDQHKVWKYIYWFDDNQLSCLQKEIKEQGIDIVCAQYAPCEALKGEIGYAEPHVWPLICKPDATPWYDKSKFRGKNLVATSFPLDESYNTFLETTITPVSFKPPYIPSIQEKEAVWWRNACLLYFQTFSKRPFPDDIEKPDQTLQYYMNLSYPYAPK